MISASLIVDLISELAKFGYETGPQTEITIEINPATVDERRLETYLKAGVNRFSVGAQSFSDRLLKMVKREHNAEQTLQTLELLRKYKLNFSFDILFALPTQTVDELQHDVRVAVELGSKHISPYCLTVPEGHPLSKNRPLDDEQIEMFSIIHNELSRSSFNRYEISNYAQTGFESQHNLLYWTDQEYWGLGLSAHSYSRKTTWGSRFWNHNSFKAYEDQMLSAAGELRLMNYPAAQIEHLEKHQSLTDFCYTSLRLAQGLPVDDIVEKFGTKTRDQITSIAKPLIEHQLLSLKSGHYRLTDAGLLVSNQVFEKFAFLNTDLA